jgi:hypothetical protein
VKNCKTIKNQKIKLSQQQNKQSLAYLLYTGIVYGKENEQTIVACNNLTSLVLLSILQNTSK